MRLEGGEGCRGSNDGLCSDRSGASVQKVYIEVGGEVKKNKNFTSFGQPTRLIRFASDGNHVQICLKSCFCVDGEGWLFRTDD